MIKLILQNILVQLSRFCIKDNWVLESIIEHAEIKIFDLSMYNSGSY